MGYMKRQTRKFVFTRKYETPRRGGHKEERLGGGLAELPCGSRLCLSIELGMAGSYAEALSLIAEGFGVYSHLK